MEKRPRADREESPCIGLNAFRDEVMSFLEAICALEEPVERKTEMLRNEIALLEAHLQDDCVVRHQVYDLLFLVFEIAAQCDIDLDSEWIAGRSRKQEKYL